MRLHYQYVMQSKLHLDLSNSVSMSSTDSRRKELQVFIHGRNHIH